VSDPDFDSGPPSAAAEICSRAPTPAKAEAFWTAWGPVFYRGRLDGSARLLCIASDPGPTERVAGRTLVGDAGQRVQGFVSKLGLTRSYLCTNAFPYALHPSFGGDLAALLAESAEKAWRHEFYDAVVPSALEAVVLFGKNAQAAFDLWPGKPSLHVERVPHPSSRDEARLLHDWSAAITNLRGIVTPDRDGNASGPNYGSSFRESDYAPIPRFDLPFGAPTFLGDDHRGRTGQPRRNDSVKRPAPDDGHTLIWTAPR
jgi:hypothetical protein